MLKGTGLTALWAGLSACAGQGDGTLGALCSLAGAEAPVRSREASRTSRVIRTVVGLRPFRHSGFRVEGEKVGEKTVVHNYGHGGGGITLSWGTRELAVTEAWKTGERRFAVLGCGAVGLATARLLQRAAPR